MTDVLDDKQKGSDHRQRCRPDGSAMADGSRGGGGVIWPARRPAYVTGQTLHVNGGMAMI